jgi:hypothetical protein
MHRARLSGLAAYCFPMESNPQAVEVRGEEATLRFTVSCPGPLPRENAPVHRAYGKGSFEFDVALLPLDGGAPVTILDQPREQAPTSWR